MKKILSIILLLISLPLLAQEELDYKFRNEMYSKSLSELKILRNEFFARKGYKFKSKELSNHFNQFNWYKGNKSLNEIELSQTDKAKVDLIKKIEYQKKLSQPRIKMLELLTTLEGNSMGSWDWSKADRVKYVNDCKKVGYLINDNSGMVQKRFINDNHLFVQVIDGGWEFVVIPINDNKFFILINDIVGGGNNFDSYLSDENKTHKLNEKIFPENWEYNFNPKGENCEFPASPFMFDFTINDETISVENWEDECLIKKKLIFKFDKKKLKYELIK